MTRLLFAGGTIFNGTGEPSARSDLVVENGRVLEIGGGLDGDQAIDCTGLHLLPGFFDTHVHVMLSNIDMWRIVQTPFSLRFFEASRNLTATLRTGITTVRDAGGADLGVKQAVERGLISGPRMSISLNMLSQTGGHGDGWMASAARLSCSHRIRVCLQPLSMVPMRCVAQCES